MLKIKVKISYLLAAVLLIFLSGAVAWIFAVRESAADQCTDYKWLNPRFICGYKAVIDKKEYSELKFRINKYIEEEKKGGKITEIGVWFRDLEAGPTFGINERMDFIPASLLKLPLAMTFLELSETRPELLTTKITYGAIAISDARGITNPGSHRNARAGQSRIHANDRAFRIASA